VRGLVSHPWLVQQVNATAAENSAFTCQKWYKAWASGEHPLYTPCTRPIGSPMRATEAGEIGEGGISRRRRRAQAALAAGARVRPNACNQGVGRRGCRLQAHARLRDGPRRESKPSSVGAGQGPTFDRSVGRKPRRKAGEAGWRRKSSLSGATQSGLATSEWRSWPRSCHCCQVQGPRRS